MKWAAETAKECAEAVDAKSTFGIVGAESPTEDSLLVVKRHHLFRHEMV
jgi:hypothetical protein